MKINIGAIMSKVDAFSKTPEGKRRIKERLETYRRDGRSTTAAGGKIVTESMMAEAADKMIACLQNAARSCGVQESDTRESVMPGSVMDHFDSLKHSEPVRQPDGSYSVAIYFEDNLHRDSLQPDRYGGVDNIVAVLNNGYDYNPKIWYVEGEWHGAQVHAKPERIGLRFIQQAVSDFNTNYGSKYGATAFEGAAYE